MNAEDLERASAALVDALLEANELAGAGRIGDELRDLVQHARELHDIIMTGLDGVSTSSALWAMAHGIGDRLRALEALAGAQRQQIH